MKFEEFVHRHNADHRNSRNMLRVTSSWYILNEKYYPAPKRIGVKIDVPL